MILNTSKLLKFFSVVNKVEFDLNFRQFYAKLRGVDLRKRPKAQSALVYDSLSLENHWREMYEI